MTRNEKKYLKCLLNECESGQLTSGYIYDELKIITNDFSLDLVCVSLDEAKLYFKELVSKFIANQYFYRNRPKDELDDYFTKELENDFNNYLENGIISIGNTKLNQFLDQFLNYKVILDILRSRNNSEYIHKEEINIDIEALKEYFKPQFKQQDVDYSNFDTLINDLRGGLPSYTQNDITAIASIIYDSDKLLSAKKPHTFNKWLKAFCFMINRDVPTSKPSGVKKQIENLSGTFYYITTE